VDDANLFGRSRSRSRASLGSMQLAQAAAQQEAALRLAGETSGPRRG